MSETAMHEASVDSFGRGEACEVGIKSVDIPHAIDSTFLFSFEKLMQTVGCIALTFIPRAYMEEGTEHITHLSTGVLFSSESCAWHCIGRPFFFRRSKAT